MMPGQRSKRCRSRAAQSHHHPPARTIPAEEMAAAQRRECQVMSVPRHVISPDVFRIEPSLGSKSSSESTPHRKLHSQMQITSPLRQRPRPAHAPRACRAPRLRGHVLLPAATHSIIAQPQANIREAHFELQVFPSSLTNPHHRQSCRRCGGLLTGRLVRARASS